MGTYHVILGVAVDTFNGHAVEITIDWDSMSNYPLGLDMEPYPAGKPNLGREDPCRKQWLRDRLLELVPLPTPPKEPAYSVERSLINPQTWRVVKHKQTIEVIAQCKTEAAAQIVANALNKDGK